MFARIVDETIKKYYTIATELEFTVLPVESEKAAGSSACHVNG